MCRASSILSVTAIALVGIQEARSAEISTAPAEVEEVIVTGESSNSHGDGEAILEDLDVDALSHAEIFRGAAAFKYGALTLGGAINLVPFTGYDAAPFQSRLEGGSYGYFRAQISSGAVEGPFDEFGSISSRLRDGFREHSRENTEILFANVGHPGSDRSQSGRRADQV